MTTHDVEDQLEEFVRTAFSVSPSDPGFDRTADLFDRGYIDSVGLAELLEFIRERFHVEVPEDDLLADDFSSIKGMGRIIQQHMAG